MNYIIKFLAVIDAICLIGFVLFTIVVIAELHKKD